MTHELRDDTEVFFSPLRATETVLYAVLANCRRQASCAIDPARLGYGKGFVCDGSVAGPARSTGSRRAHIDEKKFQCSPGVWVARVAPFGLGTGLGVERSPCSDSQTDRSRPRASGAPCGDLLDEGADAGSELPAQQSGLSGWAATCPAAPRLVLLPHSSPVCALCVSGFA